MFYCWLDYSILVTRISFYTSSAINQWLDPKAQKIGLIGTILAISLITQEIQELANLFALQFCLAFRIYWLSSLHDYYLEIRPPHNIFRGRKFLFYWFFNLVVKASPSTKIFFLLIPAGNAKISATERKTIKSNGNLPIPHSEKARANVVSCIYFF